MNNFIERSAQGAVSFFKEALFSDGVSASAGFLQSVEPRLKAAGMFLMVFAAVISRDVLFIAVLYFLCLALGLSSRIRLGALMLRTWFFVPLFSLAIAVPALFKTFTPGEPILSWSIWRMHFTITQQGAEVAGIFLLRVVTCVSLSVLLSSTTPHTALLAALRSFGVPQVFVMVLGMSYRYIYFFVTVVERSFMAIKSRVGVALPGRKGRQIVGLRLASLWQRSQSLNEQIYLAMCARGFEGEPRVAKAEAAGIKDWCFFLGSLFLLGLSFYKHY